MRAFVSSVLVALIIAVGGYVVLRNVQEPASVAYSTEGVRL
jgi:hypothetical protein